MEDKRFDLTPRQILSHLHDIEKVAPLGEFRIYRPTALADVLVTDLAIVEETRKMLEFVGLPGYELDVTYAKTAEGTAATARTTEPRRLFIFMCQIPLGITGKRLWQYWLMKYAIKYCL